MPRVVPVDHELSGRAIVKPSAGKVGARRWVVKIGSALLTDQGRGLDHALIRRWVDQMASLRKAGIDPVLVPEGERA